MLVVVGGHTRNIGKTSVVAGLITALAEFHWTALKITQYGHNACSTDGEPCECAPTDSAHAFAISEETDRHSGTDSGRYLAAGAQRSFWVRTAEGQLGYALPAVREILDASPNVIAESNSILQFVKPDLYLVVLDFDASDFKPTSLRYLDRADALIVIDNGTPQPAWGGVSRTLWESKPRFPVRPPQWVTEAIAALVRGRLTGSVTSSAGAGIAGRQDRIARKPSQST